MRICVQEGPLSDEYLLRSVCGGDWDLEGFVLPLCQQFGRLRENTRDADGSLCVFFKTGGQVEEIA